MSDCKCGKCLRGQLALPGIEAVRQGSQTASDVIPGRGYAANLDWVAVDGGPWVTKALMDQAAKDAVGVEKRQAWAEPLGLMVVSCLKCGMAFVTSSVTRDLCDSCDWDMARDFDDGEE